MLLNDEITADLKAKGFKKYHGRINNDEKNEEKLMYLKFEHGKIEGRSIDDKN